MTALFLSIIALCSLAVASSEAVEVQPVINAELMAGQYWYNGADSSMGGLASLSASPYLKFNDRWSLSPLYQGRYQGTAQVTDFTGGGTLFQDSQSHSLSAKGIHKVGDHWKFKAITGYAFEWLRETEDEDWTEGLYDNRRLSAGVETEYEWSEQRLVRLAYDYYRIHFPNYESLESQQVDAGLGRELAQPDVLDNQNHRILLAGQTPVPGRGLLEASLSGTWRAFPDQNLVEASGDLTPDTRDDTLYGLGLEGTWPVAAWTGARLFGSLGYGWSRLDSDQSSYDASKTTFRPNFYDYTTHSLRNRWTLLMREEKPWSLNMAFLFARQSYADRLVQDAEGTYGTDTTRVDSTIVSFGASYPIAKNFALRGQVDLGWSNSNNTYARVYQYHYNTQSYLLGFSYAY